MVDVFKQKYGYEIEGIWFPRVTAIVSLTRRLGDRDRNQWLGRNGFWQAAQWGQLAHETIEKILQGEQVRVEARIAIAIGAFQEWHAVHRIGVQDIERRVWDRKNGYAGTVDIIGTIGGIVGVIDLKTGTKILREYALQTAAYMNAYQMSSGDEKTCTTRWILRIDQYQECMGCLAKRREKYGRAKVTGGKVICNHQWSPVKGEVELKELNGYKKDLEDFFALKERWEWEHKELLKHIPNYTQYIRQYTLF